MAGFSRLIGGEWRMTAASGTSMFDTWHWGPGRHSVRMLTDGQGADGSPWRALQAVYWHPGDAQVRLLALNPYAESVAEGTITLEGDIADAVFDMHQTGHRRRLRSRWTFTGADTYHDELLEATGTAGYAPLAAWDRVRVVPREEKGPAVAAEARTPTAHLRAFEALLGHTWEAKGEWARGASPGALHVQSTFEWVPLANGVYVRVVAPGKDGGAAHVLDAYVYHHTGAGVVRCLALSAAGGVYEGDVRVLDGGAIEMDLKGYEGERVVSRVVRLDLEADGTARSRVWSVEAGARTLMLDVRSRRLEPGKE
jgi:hypothetical protein